jgi:hypothetical protein
VDQEEEKEISLTDDNNLNGTQSNSLQQQKIRNDNLIVSFFQ